MLDFDTRNPHEPNEPNRLRFPLMANKLRALLIGGGILLFVVAAVPVGLLIYSSSGPSNRQQAVKTREEDVEVAGTVTCERWMLGKTGTCYAPSEGDTAEVCQAESRYEVDDETPCSPAGDWAADGPCEAFGGTLQRDANGTRTCVVP